MNAGRESPSVGGQAGKVQVWVDQPNAWVSHSLFSYNGDKFQVAVLLIMVMCNLQSLDKKQIEKKKTCGNLLHLWGIGVGSCRV